MHTNTRRTLSDETAEADKLSIMFGRVFMHLAMLSLPLSATDRRQLLAELTPCVEAVGKLFLLDDVELVIRPCDRWALSARLTSWFLELERVYTGGARGLARMAVRFATINGKLQAGQDPNKPDLAFLLDRVSMLEKATSSFSQFSEDLDQEIGECLEAAAGLSPIAAFQAEIDQMAQVEAAITSRSSYQPEVIIVYSTPVSPYRRRYFVLDPTLHNPSLLGGTSDGNITESPLESNVIGIMERFDTMESYCSISFESHFLDVIVAVTEDWEDFEEDLEEVLIAWFMTTRISFNGREAYDLDEDGLGSSG